MAYSTTKKIGHLAVKAYRGDFKTLLAWSFDRDDERHRLAGFTIRCAPKGRTPYYLYNLLTFEHPENHAQIAGEPDRSSVNAPLHKFRWVHVPGQDHQGLEPLRGSYTYTIFPRYFDANKRMTPLDEALGVPVTIDVLPFVKGPLTASFTRGYVQSQAFVGHFGKKAKFEPKTHDVVFDPDVPAGKDDQGKPYTYLDEYKWCGFTARETIFALLDAVEADAGLTLDVFAYDLKEPGVIASLERLARDGRLRLILDDAGLHHSTKKTIPEDAAEAFIVANAPGTVKRGHFQRYSHDKVFVVHDVTGPLKVMTGSTNFAITGMYVNSNHVLVYDDRDIAEYYAGVFETAWSTEVKKPAFVQSKWSKQVFPNTQAATPRTEIRFSPHSAADAQQELGDIATRIAAETSSVMFAVMSTGGGTGPVLPALEALHANGKVFSFGISDSPSSVSLYKPGQAQGILVTGKPKDVLLPPPFNQVPGLGLGHQVHHKFVVCGFNTPQAVVYCGSSNLAEGGEKDNGDNLLAIHDADVAAAFAIEALLLVDHFNFLDSNTKPAADAAPPPPEASLTAAAKKAGTFLGVTDLWTVKYFNPTDLKCVDRLLFVS